MALTGDRQDQSGGDNSTNQQAGRDAIQITGVTPTEARHIAQGVFFENFPTLRGIAEDVARARADEITETFVRRIEGEQSEVLNSLKDPDMLKTLLNGQEAFALSGEPDLEQVLVDLMADRALQADRSLITLVLNEAVSVAGKLTERQRRAVALVFLTRYTRPTGIPAIILPYLLNSYVIPNFEPFRDVADLSRAECQHIAFVGVGAIGAFETKFEDAIRNAAPQAFMRNTPIAKLRGGILAPYENELWQPEDDDSRGRFTASIDDVLNRVKANGSSSDVDVARRLYKDSLASVDEVRGELSASAEWMAPMIEAWNDGHLKMVTLTSVGIAIGHAYWKRVTGAASPLSVWLN